MQVHYPVEAIQNDPFLDSKMQLLEAQVSFFIYFFLPFTIGEGTGQFFYSLIMVYLCDII